MTDLYRLLMVLKQPNTNIGLMFNSADAANQAYADATKADAEIFSLEDHFGNMATIERKEVAAFLLTHVNKELNAQIEQKMLALHAEAKAQNRVATDPMLKGLQQPRFAMPGNAAMPGFQIPRA